MKLLLTILMVFICAPAQAFEWSDLWLNDYQKAQKMLQEQPAEAAEKFHDPEWQGVAKYNAGSYQEAAEKFSKSGDAASEYNLGNALARAGDLEKSLQSYDSLLEKPDLPEQLQSDAKFNRDLVKKLIEQQEQQEQQSEENSKDSNDSSESDEKQEPDAGDQQGQEAKDQQSGQQSQSDQEQAPSEAEPDDKEPGEEQQQADKRDEDKPSPQSEETKNQAQSTQDQQMTEDQQATEQWLRQIPDDPSGLLRRKLVQSHRTKYPQVRNGAQAW